MGLRDWALQGRLNDVHPAATILLLLVIGVSFLLRKSFCAWICPVGLISESLARLGRRMYGRNFRIWRPADVVLRGLKFLLLGFFVKAIFTMAPAALHAFIQSPYNRVSDIKMGLFFVELGQVGAVVLAVLALASTFVHGAWCRYLCPYGALLGIFSWLSPVRVKRQAASCVDCRLCDRVCMARLPVSRSGSVSNPECTGCLDCVAVCPVRDTLIVRAGSRRLPVWGFAMAVVLLFVGGYLSARVGGLWDNHITDAEYVHRVQNLHGPEYGHPGRQQSQARANEH
jgi:polyferredoxin